MKRKRNQIIGSDGELLAPFSQKRKRSEQGESGRRGLLIMFVLVNLGLLAMFVYINTASRMQLADAVAITATVTVEPGAPTQIVPLGALDLPTLPPTWTAEPTSTATDTPTVTPTPTASPTPTTTPQVRERVVTIEAQAGWQSGEVLLEPGEVIEISYVEGKWESWPGTGPFGPDGGFFGICDQDDCVEPLRAYSQAGMIGRVGNDGNMFGVGYKYSFVAETGGELQLRINDDYTTDNSGSITMRIIVKRYND
jgi:hypothetical protein